MLSLSAVSLILLARPAGKSGLRQSKVKSKIAPRLRRAYSRNAPIVDSALTCGTTCTRRDKKNADCAGCAVAQSLRWAMEASLTQLRKRLTRSTFHRHGFDRDSPLRSVSADASPRAHATIPQGIRKSRSIVTEHLGDAQDDVRHLTVSYPTRGGTFPRRGPNPSAMVRCVMTASRSFV